MTQNKTLSIVIPMFNEQKTIGEILKLIDSVFSPSKLPFEVIVVDDGSKDNSVEVAQQTINSLGSNNYKLFVSEKNQGKGAAIRQGIKLINGKYCVIQDADLEYHPSDLITMLEYMEQHHLEVLYGSRILKKDNVSISKIFYLGGRLVTLATNILFWQRLTDEPTCYKMFSTKLLKEIPLKCTGFEFCPEVTAKVAKRGYKIKEIPISYSPRTIQEGKKISWRDGVEAIWTLLRYRFCK
ncbi:MAG: glycosyltransferase family 2 protein [Rikenellaceae bacterium]